MSSGLGMMSFSSTQVQLAERPLNTQVTLGRAVAVELANVC